jgi:hypothetical protein
MTPRTSAPEQRLINDLPATMAGLWTAITVTHDIAAQLVDRADPEASERPSMVAASCAEAAQGLAMSRREALQPIVGAPKQRIHDAVDGLTHVGALTGDCIDLAIDLLANEGEPLTPVEVLAVTRAVTALCTARTLAQGAIA